MKKEYLSVIQVLMKHPMALVSFLKYWNSNATEFLSETIQDEKLLGGITTLTGMLGDSLDNLHGLIFAGMWKGYHRGGYYNLEGGSLSITDALEKMIKKNGGEILPPCRATISIRCPMAC